MSGITCPACHASNVMRQRMVHDAGTSATTTTTTGVGGVVGGGGVAPGAFAASSSGTQQSALAKKCAPPEKEPVVSVFVVAAIILFFGLLVMESGGVVRIWVTLGLAGFCVFGAITGLVQNRTEYPAKLVAYERRWICLTCGHAWERETPGAVPLPTL